jgi:hypothetical protein
MKKVIADLSKARKHFDNFNKKFEDIGRGLEKAQEAFGVATTHLGKYRGSVNKLAGGADEELDELAGPSGPISETPQLPLV